MAETATSHPGRNEPCHCGSGKKYKHCCLEKDEKAAREARAKADAAAPAPEPAPATEQAPRRGGPRQATDQPWKRSAQNTRGFQKFSGPRKVGGGG